MAERDSLLKKVVDRLQEAIARPNIAECDIYKVRGYDVRVLFETLKRYGGRRDWTPSEDNIEQLPGPVRRYIYQQRVRIAELERQLIDASAARRRIEAELAELRRPRR